METVALTHTLKFMDAFSNIKLFEQHSINALIDAICVYESVNEVLFKRC